MVTLDVYLLLSIIGIGTISLYVNIFVAVKVRNRFVYTDELEKADSEIEDLHIQNMALIELCGRRRGLNLTK